MQPKPVLGSATRFAHRVIQSDMHVCLSGGVVSADMLAVFVFSCFYFSHHVQVQSQWVGPYTFSFKAEVDFDGTYLAAQLRSRSRRVTRESGIQSCMRKYQGHDSVFAQTIVHHASLLFIV